MITLFRDAVKTFPYVIPFRLNASCSVAGRIVAAAPEFSSGVDTFLRDTFQHGLAAFRAGRRVVFDALLRTIGQALGGEVLGKAPFGTERLQLAFYLTAEHQCQPVAENEQAVGSQQGIIAGEPWVEFVFLY